MESVEDRAFIKYLRSRRIQILRETRIADASGKCDDMSEKVRNRKNNATEKLISRWTDKNTRIDDKFLCETESLQMIEEITRG